MLGHDQVQGDVPWSHWQPRHTLALVGDADQAGTPPMVPMGEVAQGPIIVAAAHAQPVTVGVESDQGDQQEFKGPGEAQPAIASGRFRDAKAVQAHGVTRAVGKEPKPRVRVRAQDRELPDLAPGLGQVEQGSRVDLAIGGPVDTDPPGPEKGLVSAQAPSKRPRMVTLLGGRQATTQGAQPSAQGGRGIRLRDHAGRGMGTSPTCADTDHRS
jgi:hypothetical protein